MKLEIGSTIARLRHARGITQEQLALAIGVSAPAVSKWENEQSYPDITLLPPLARFFDISVDTLLAYSPALTDEALDKALEDISLTFEGQGWAAGIAACRALLRRYPTDPALRISLVGVLMRNGVFAGDAAQLSECRSCQVEWLEEAAQLDQGEIGSTARQLLGVMHLSQRNPDAAAAILEGIGDAPVNTRQFMPTLRMQQGRYEEAERLAQVSLFNAMHEAMSALLTLTAIAARQEDGPRAERYVRGMKEAAASLSMASIFRHTIAQGDLIAAQAQNDDEGLLAAAAQLKQAFDAPAPLADNPYLFRLQKAEAPPSDAYTRRLLSMVADDLEKRDAFARLRGDLRFDELIAQMRV